MRIPGRAKEAAAADVPPAADAQPTRPPRRSVRLLLIMASSAMLGGVTVALWNRKALQQLRQGYPPEPASDDPLQRKPSGPHPPEHI